MGQSRLFELILLWLTFPGMAAIVLLSICGAISLASLHSKSSETARDPPLGVRREEANVVPAVSWNHFHGVVGASMNSSGRTVS
jgi:hypothetical protein